MTAVRGATGPHRGRRSLHRAAGDVLLAAALVGVLGALAGCSGDGTDDGASAIDGAERGHAVDAGAGVAFALPWGLKQAEGTLPLGRPVVFDPYTTDGTTPSSVRGLLAGYWVTAEDAVAVFDEWVGQLDRLTLDEIDIVAGSNTSSPWLHAVGFTTGDGDGRRGDRADLQLWAVSSRPILLVHLERAGHPPRPGRIDGEIPRPPRPPPLADDGPRGPGDVLFREQGDVVHLPAGTRSLMPTIPTTYGTGGSTSILAAQDPVEAIEAMLEEARRGAGVGVAGPLITADVDDTRVIRGSFKIEAGGWFFTALAVRGEGDPFATVYVTSGAD